MRNLNPFYPFLIFSITVIILFSCDDTLTSNDVDQIIIPDKNVSYAEHIDPVLRLKCATSGCHDEYRAGGFSFLLWTFTREAVVENLPNNSPLYLSVGGPLPTMPPIGRGIPLTDNQVKGIKTWISEGAQNN